MKLYYHPGVCSLSSHIVLREAGLAPELVQVALKTHLTETGQDYYAINPKGYVPALVLDDGEVLTENVAINLYVADQNPAAGLAPPRGSLAYTRMVEWLIYISTELHKNFGPLFSAVVPEEVKEMARERLQKRFAYTAEQLGGKDYLMGDQFTLPDSYLFTVLNWAEKVGLDLSAHKNLAAYRARVAARPKVQEALRAEGLLAA